MNPSLRSGQAAVFFRQTERAFLRQLVGDGAAPGLAPLLGWRCYHTFDSRRSAAGFPDLVLIRRPRVVFAELKAERTPVTDDQRAWIEELRACGQEAYIWRPSMWREIETCLR